MASKPVNQAPIASDVLKESGASRASSHVRVRGFDTERAVRRVTEYFRALGLSDEGRLYELSSKVARECAPADGSAPLPEHAVARAQSAVEEFRRAVFGPDADAVDPLWLRAFIGACPRAFLAEPAWAREAVRRFGDPLSGKPPVQARFSDQELRPARVPRWLAGLVPPVLGTVAATLALALAFPAGTGAIGAVWLALFALLFGVGAIGLWVASLGFVLSRTDRARAPRPTLEGPPLPRSALVMPVYHESAEHVFAAVAAMREALGRTDGGDAFEIFVLSDSSDPERVAEEERAYRRIACAGDEQIPVFYRRRARNDRQKAGNLAEFFERWGKRYVYAVVLDADSLMRGDTLVEMIRRMEAAPRLALLQAPLSLRGGETCFARAQQFVASTTGPLFTRGLAAWSGAQGNYYGHNAAIRVRAFLECCALPVLAGEPPLGGHILSHDFVEAALLCRAGWEVRIAHDLDGSWEELPPTLPEYVARDRRWCQGNLQHLRVVLAQGFAPMSRIHMLCGVAAYLAGPAWVAFVALGVWLAGAGGGRIAPASALLVACATLLVLLGPRVLGLLRAYLDPEERRRHGDAPRLVASALLEIVLGGVLSPLLMLHHTRIVLSIVLGRTVRWGPQKRRVSGHRREVIRGELAATVTGLCFAAFLARYAPALFWPLSPVWLPLTCAIPTALALSSRRLGRFLFRVGLLRVPNELEPDELVLRAEELRTLTTPDESARFRDLVLDPLLSQAQIARLEREREEQGGRRGDGVDLERLRRRALRVGPAALSSAERRALACDPQSLRFLHREAWRHWPVESWHIARFTPQLPPELG